MFQIFVDSAANLPAVTAKKYNIHVISFVNLISGKEVTCYNPDLSPEEEREKGKEYYDAMRKGCEIKTGLISTATFEEKFQKAFDADQDVLYLSLSKNISGNFNSARLAAEELLSQNTTGLQNTTDRFSQRISCSRDFLPSMQVSCVTKACPSMKSPIL